MLLNRGLTISFTTGGGCSCDFCGFEALQVTLLLLLVGFNDRLELY